MQYVIMFIPWIAYAITVNFTSWAVALVISLVLAAIVATRDLIVTRQVDYLNTGGVLFFAGFLIASVMGAPDSVSKATQIASHAWIAALMWFSVVRGRPFTTAAARREAPPEAWDMPFFLRMNRQISSLWALSFTVATVIMLVVEPLNIPGLVPSIQGLSILFPVLYMQRYITVAEREGERLSAEADNRATATAMRPPAAAA